MKMIQEPFLDGIQRTYYFDNNLKVSAVKTSFSYGGDKGLWEIAVLDKNSFITKNIFSGTDDVIGFIRESELYNYLEAVKKYGE